MPDLYIPTYGRVGRQATLFMLPPRWRERTALVCRPEEKPFLLDLYQEMGVVVLDTPKRVQGISETRQWIFNGTQGKGTKLLMFDDDLKFAKRRLDDPTKFTPLEPESEEIGVMIDLLWNALDEAPVVGLASRGGANRDPRPWKLNQRLFDVMGFRMDCVRANGFRYRQKFMEDFDLQLQFLTRGFPTLMLNAYTKDDYGSNTDGGCSSYRDAFGQMEASLSLWEEWPDFVSVRQVKAEWAGIGQRTDVIVQWAKAFKAGQKWRADQGLPPYPIPEWVDESGLL